MSIASPRPSLNLPSSRRGSASTINSTRSVSTSRPASIRDTNTANSTPVPASTRRRDRAALREFYNLQATEPTTKPPPSAPTSQPEDSGPQDALSALDHPSFSAKTYADELLNTSDAATLLRTLNAITISALGLEGDKKALVYDNYTTLLSATSTISRMRENVDPMAPVTTTLEPAVKHIADVAKSIADSRNVGDVEKERQKEVVKWVLGAPERLKRMKEQGKEEEVKKEWDEGGPGCSSLEGFLQENGRFTWLPGTYAPTENPYSWVNLTNMLWVEQPVGTGFSMGTPRATSEEEVAQDFIKFFKNFEALFGITNYKIYVTGESYAGRYVPYISAAMLDQNDTEYYDLSGALVYDPCIGDFDYTQEEVVVVPFAVQNQNILNLNASFLAKMENLHQSCGYADYIDKYLTFPASGVQPPVLFNFTSDASCDLFDLINEAALVVNPCFDIYEITQICPLLWDVLGFPTQLVYSPAGADVYFNRTDVKRAIHAPLNVSWAECSNNAVFTGGNSGPETEGDTSPDPIQHVLPQVIEATNRVLIGNGDFDMIIITNGTLMSIQNMTWNGKLGFETQPSTPINITMPDLMYADVFASNGYKGLDGPQGIMGIQVILPEENYGLFEISDARVENEGSTDEQLMRQVDIVAVHGLMGHWANTWNSGNSHGDSMFLRDRIPSDLSRIGVRARIFSYGYDSAVVFSKSAATIDQAAIMLLSRLLGKRRTSEEKGRPIIFIAHSLGGLVVKQAMIQAWTRNEYYNDILENVKGCLFLGVPHRGADLAYWAKLPAQIIPYISLGFRGNSKLLESLSSKSADWMRISRDFVHRATSLQIRTFYETDRLGNVIVVDESSATMSLPNELALPLAGSNHATICKFAASENQRYDLVKDALEDLVRAALGTTQTASDSPLRSDMPLRTDTFCGREAEIQTMAEALHPEKPGQKGLVLYGIGGSGKTQLALQYIQTYGSIYEAIIWINASNTQDLDASFAEAADLLYEKPDNTASRHSTATPQRLVVAELRNPRSSPWLLVMDSVDDLIVTSTRANASEVFRFPSLEIDRLDESSGCQLLQKIVGDVAVPGTDWAAHINKELHGIPLAIEHAGVLIRTYLSPDQFLQSYRARYRWLLTEFPDRGVLAYDKDRSIITVFDLLFKKVKEKYPEAGALLIFVAILGIWKIPTTFLNQYKGLLSDIQSEDDQESQQLVQVLSTPEALQLALSQLANLCLVKRDSVRGHPSKSIMIHRAIRDWSLQTSVTGKQIWLLQAARGLVAATLCYDQQKYTLNVSQQRRTLDRAFLAPLRQCVVLIRGKIPEHEMLPPDGRYCQQYAELVVELAQVDLSCGLLSDAEKNFKDAIEYRRIEGGADWPSSRMDLMLLEGLAVVRFRSADFDSCIEILESALELAGKFYQPFDPEAEAIRSYYRIVFEKRETMQQHHKSAVLARSESKMNTQDVEPSGDALQDETLVPPSYGEQQTVPDRGQLEHDYHFNADLRGAASSGFVEEVKRLLSIERIDLNSQDKNGMTALSWAIYNRHEAVVQLLLGVDQIDTNVKDMEDWTPLHRYSHAGHNGIVQKLLQKGAEVNARGGNYGTALQAASTQGHDKIVQMLLEHDADVNAQGGYYDTALQAASAWGRDEIVQMLLEHDANVNAHGGYFGTALQAASANGHDKVVQMLLERNADVNSHFGFHGSALHVAAGKGHEKIVQILLDSQARLTGLHDSALHVAAEKGHEKIVQMLLESEARLTTETLFDLYANKSVKLTPSLASHIQREMIAEIDRFEKTLLHWAAERGHQTATERCLDLGAKVDARDKFRRTALHYAAEHGHLEVKANRK
ncbi:serine carboxypeptidase, partial [Aureobasidium melanogenum]